MKIIKLITIIILITLTSSCSNDESSVLETSANDYLTDGLMAYFPFDGDWEDEVTPNNFVESNSAAPTFKADKNGNTNGSIFFSGAGEYLKLNLQSFSTEQGFTIACFVRNEMEQPAIAQRFLADHPNGEIAMTTTTADVSRIGGNMYFQIDQITQTTGVNYGHTHTAEVVSWHHLAMSFDGQVLRFYFDGEFLGDFLVGEEQNGSPIYQTYSDFILGGSHDLQTFWSGCIDELFFYTRALSDQEVQQLYNR